MGIGMVVIAAADKADDLVREFTAAGEGAWRAGTIEKGGRDVVLS